MLWERYSVFVLYFVCRSLFSGRRRNYIVSVVFDDTTCIGSVACRYSAFRLLRMCLRNICFHFYDHIDLNIALYFVIANLHKSLSNLFIMYERPYIKEIQARIEEPRKFIQVILGPRQVGKTTMVNQLLQKLSLP